MKQIDWKRTLNNIVFTHDTEEVVFNIKDIEDLSAYINDLIDNTKRLQKLVKHRDNTIDVLHSRLSSETLKHPTKLDTYKINIKV